jgi:hypothetical protein
MCKSSSTSMAYHLRDPATVLMIEVRTDLEVCRKETGGNQAQVRNCTQMHERKNQNTNLQYPSTFKTKWKSGSRCDVLLTF